MATDWNGIIGELKRMDPALWGRLIRHVLTLLAGVGLVKGLTADQSSALQGLIEITISGVLFGVSLVLSHRSDAKAAQAGTSEATSASRIGPVETRERQ